MTRTVKYLVCDIVITEVTSIKYNYISGYCLFKYMFIQERLINNTRDNLCKVTVFFDAFDFVLDATCVYVIPMECMKKKCLK